MSSKEQRELERDIERIMDDCASKLRAWINQPPEHIWSRINQETKEAERKLLRKVKELWPKDDN